LAAPADAFVRLLPLPACYRGDVAAFRLASASGSRTRGPVFSDRLTIVVGDDRARVGVDETRPARLNRAR